MAESEVSGTAKLLLPRLRFPGHRYTIMSVHHHTQRTGELGTCSQHTRQLSCPDAAPRSPSNRPRHDPRRRRACNTLVSTGHTRPKQHHGSILPALPGLYHHLRHPQSTRRRYRCPTAAASTRWCAPDNLDSATDGCQLLGPAAAVRPPEHAAAAHHHTHKRDGGWGGWRGQDGGCYMPHRPRGLHGPAFEFLYTVYTACNMAYVSVDAACSGGGQWKVTWACIEICLVL